MVKLLISLSKNGSTDHRVKSFYCVKLYAQRTYELKVHA